MTAAALQIIGMVAVAVALVALAGPWWALLAGGIVATFVGLGVERAKMGSGRR